MSGSSLGIGALPPSQFGVLGQVIGDSTAVQNAMTKLTEQASSGLVSSSYAGLGANAQSALDLNAQISGNTATINGITAANSNIQITQTVMNQLSSIASNFNAQLDSITPGGATLLASQAQQALQQVASLLDTQSSGSYIFAGQDSGNAPIPNPGGILGSGFYTQINTAVGNLPTTGATATAASTLAIASSNAAGTTPFSATLSGPAPVVATGAGQSTTVGVLANANTLIPASTGTSTTGSYMRDLLRGLATIASFTSTVQGASGFQSLVQNTQTSLTGAISGLAQEEGALGAAQNSINATSTTLGDTNTALTTQVSNLTNVNMAATLSNLTLVQTQLQASYKLIAGFNNLSLVQYV